MSTVETGLAGTNRISKLRNTLPNEAWDVVLPDHYNLRVLLTIERGDVMLYCIPVWSFFGVPEWAQNEQWCGFENHVYRITMYEKPVDERVDDAKLVRFRMEATHQYVNGFRAMMARTYLMIGDDRVDFHYAGGRIVEAVINGMTFKVVKNDEVYQSVYGYSWI